MSLLATALALLFCAGDEPDTRIWKTTAPFFQPPAEFAGKLGSYRSPLLLSDGTRVKSADDWQRRRKELLDTWHGLMGPWTAVIEKPKLDVLSEESRDGLNYQHVRLEIAPKQTGDGWLLVPQGKGPFPAVLVVYYEPETSIGRNSKQPLRDFGLQLAKRGFVTLSIGTPGGDARQPDMGTATCQPLSFHAYVAANCWHALANLPEVDKKRIGVVGHSYGGKWAMFAGALWDKFAAVAVSDPGIVFDETKPNVNYWEPWYLGLDPKEKRPKAGVPTADNPRTGAYKKMIETGRDLHELHALIAPRPFLVSGGSEDPPSRWIALNHAVTVNKLLEYEDRVGMTNRKDHTPNEESNGQLYAFFEHFLGNANRK
ncbi:MAG TPA: acetylxylan esterase [Gemmataceae bacterium]|nr:acetylxylan esterase [Gemmataceae bacterium]